MAWWFWILMGAVLLAAEVVISADFYLVFFGASALVVGLFVLAGVQLPDWSQWLLFAVLAVAGLAFYRRRWKRKLMSSDREMPPELVGEMGVARGRIDAGARGRVVLRGVDWDACNVGEAMLRDGDRCAVTGVDGLTLQVRCEP